MGNIMLKTLKIKPNFYFGPVILELLIRWGNKQLIDSFLLCTLKAELGVLTFKQIEETTLPYMLIKTFNHF
jgi:hypothetical protein